MQIRFNLEDPDDKLVELCTDYQLHNGMDSSDPRLGSLDCEHCPLREKCPYYANLSRYIQAEQEWVEELENE